MDPELPLLPGWRTERKLAEGGQARIFLVRRAGDAWRRPYAAKVLRLSGPGGEEYDAAEQRWRLRREVAILHTLARAGCPSVPWVIAQGMRTERSAEPWFVMPFYAGGAMWQARNGEARWAEPYRGDVDRVLGIAEGLATTLAAMHEGEPRCVHRDVNVNNVLFATPGGAPVLADFGIAHLNGSPERPARSDGPGGGAGSRSAPWRWCPPELRSADAEVTTAGDVFMLGGLIVEALSGGNDLPPCAYWPDAGLPERPEHLLLRHVGDRRVGSVLELVGRMLASDPSRRPPARAVAQVCREIRAAAAPPPILEDSFGGKPK